jgi:hypothetical protein
MSNTTSPRLTIGALAGLVIGLAGVGAYFQSSSGGPGTTAFVVRLCLVSLALVGAVIVGLAFRMPIGTTEVAHLSSPARLDRER